MMDMESLAQYRTMFVGIGDGEDQGFRLQAVQGTVTSPEIC